MLLGVRIHLVQRIQRVVELVISISKVVKLVTNLVKANKD